MKNGFRKLRRRWLVSVLSVFLLFPLLLLAVMGVNEYRGKGLAFTNLDDIFIAQRFMSLIKDRQFEAAAEFFDFANEYRDIQQALERTPDDYRPHYACMADMTEGEYVQFMKEQFIQALEVCYADGIAIQSPHYSHAYRTMGEKRWTIEISANQQYPAGEICKVEYHFRVQNGKLHTVGGSRSYSIENDPIHDVLWLHFPEP